MNSLFREDEIFEFKGELYSYVVLSELKQKSPFYKKGNVTNMETGEELDIGKLHQFYNYALIDTMHTELVSNVLKPADIRDINRKVMYTNHKQQLEEIYEKMKEGTVTLEEVVTYWEIKDFKYGGVNFNYSNKNFVKVSTEEVAIAQFTEDLSLLDLGRVIRLSQLIKYKEPNTKIDRSILYEKLEVKDSESIRRFFAKMEKLEIIKRVDKFKHREIDIYFNPFLFNRQSTVVLSASLYKMFEKSCEKFLELDVYWYLKRLSENNLEVGIDKVVVDSL